MTAGWCLVNGEQSKGPHDGFAGKTWIETGKEALRASFLVICYRVSPGNAVYACFPEFYSILLSFLLIRPF